MIGAFYYTMRLATRNPDVSWRRKDNPEPWEEYRNKQYKVGSVPRKVSGEKSIPKDCASKFSDVILVLLTHIKHSITNISLF